MRGANVPAQESVQANAGDFNMTLTPMQRAWLFAGAVVAATLAASLLSGCASTWQAGWN